MQDTQKCSHGAARRAFTFCRRLGGVLLAGSRGQRSTAGDSPAATPQRQGWA